MNRIKLFLFMMLISSAAFAQHSKVATIRYDIVRETGIPGRNKPEGAEKMQNSITEDRFVYFKDSLAYYERTKAGAKMFKNMPSAKFKLPFEEYTFTDMKNSREVISLTVLREPVEVYYSSDPIVKSTQWKDTGKTKKMLGFNCHNAKVTTENGEYDVWYTKDTEFTYSPMPGIQPSRGLVLKIEGPQIYYNAKIYEKKLDNASPFSRIYKGEKVTKEELIKIRSHSSGNLRSVKKTN